MEWGPIRLTGEISIGAIAVVISILTALIAWHRRMIQLEMKVNIMFAWFSRQTKNIPEHIVREFFGQQDK